MRLRHIHFPNVIPYSAASALQEAYVSRFLASKRQLSPQSPSPLAPTPHIITAEFRPVYTCGRREIGTVSPQQQEYLRANGRAEFVEAMRGGQTTFHGPGQLVAYPIIDLRAHKLTPRDYVCVLEKSLIATCARFGIRTMTTENTGVWTTEDDKIAAIGVHMRRHVTSHGVGLNVNTDLWWFERIVACGLEGRRTTSFEREGKIGKSVREVGIAFVEEFGEKLGAEGVDVEERWSVLMCIHPARHIPSPVLYNSSSLLSNEWWSALVYMPSPVLQARALTLTSPAQSGPMFSLTHTMVILGDRQSPRCTSSNDLPYQQQDSVRTPQAPEPQPSNRSHQWVVMAYAKTGSVLEAAITALELTPHQHFFVVLRYKKAMFAGFRCANARGNYPTKIANTLQGILMMKWCRTTRIWIIIGKLGYLADASSFSDCLRDLSELEVRIYVYTPRHLFLQSLSTHVYCPPSMGDIYAATGANILIFGLLTAASPP
ncbi:lipoyltransferase [Lindgomyces ingoldianus]|uniref:Lipoyltransferase n=1 Tax=Lindgomyces ingoldianus TaxID=673940 RepID=A0ACB6RBR8_9PLEO|nr:lipoyltransferase [Lindgomyces ingoldianus]KAF2476490.1 lipoyltransferase [Lindgomyces ingoldianus]